MRMVVGFMSSLFSFVMAVFAARPIANLVNSWFGVPANFINIFICGLAVFIIGRLLFYFLGKYITKIKENNGIVDTVDKVAGIFLGFAKFAFWMCVLFAVVHLMTFIPGLRQSAEWLLYRSVIGDWIYGIVRRFVIPF